MNNPYKYPKAKDIFHCPKFSTGKTTEEMQKTSNILTRIFLNQGIRCCCTEITNGFSNTVYHFSLTDYSATRSRIRHAESSIGMYIGASSARICFPEGKTGFTVNILNTNKPTLHLGTMLNTSKFSASHNANSGLFSIPLGIDENNRFVMTTLENLPHLIIAGSTGSGKSVCIKSLLTSLLYQAQPGTLGLILIDPKKVELNAFQTAKSSLYAPVISDVYDVYKTLFCVTEEMNRHYTAMRRASCCSIYEYNKKAKVIYPQIVIVIDELADLFGLAKDEIQPLLIRIAQLGRAAGIHLILATQYPSCKVITSELKANIPSKICFRLPTASNSRTILEQSGAELLTGCGDGLYRSGTESYTVRFQSPFVSREEIQNLIKYMEEQK